MRKVGIVATVLLSLCLFSCKKDAKVNLDGTLGPSPIVSPTITPTPTVAPSVVFSFKAMVNNQVLIPKTKYYTNASQDSFTVTKFNYYISNILLRKNDGSVYIEPQSYHLIRHIENLTTFTLENVPEGNYTAMEFLIGVDSLHNVSGAQTGALDVANGMFWDWNTGYIFFKLEGNYRSSSTPSQDYVMHIGGFSGKFNCLQKPLVSFPVLLVAQNNKQSRVYVNAVVDEVFKNPVLISFDGYYADVSQGMFQTISKNYKDMLVVDRIEN